ncbi:outer membrane beta-barrel protein [Spirosoma pollinicola]|uniref:Outer membrane protein beta-barrel domain-containing protein n=1 Tax=Spirosoma pollinicola TaxID=2057025 RepID=A0A2K8Z3A4_9BACT|nr:outer membrane beta-barrel protein [Spirosoma pollinicola]AUD04366.1 hypothetical protein CWM47_22490 [Spirosoma pollinicola]
MKTFIFILLANTCLLAQSKVSIAPSYWFLHSNYNYQIQSIYDGTIKGYDGYSVASSIGLNARYHFTPRWDLSAGLLYNKTTSHLKDPSTNDVRLGTKYIQLPILINFRSSVKRISPYFSAGAILEKSALAGNDRVKPSAVIGIGVDYRISKNVDWLVQPTGSYLFYKPDSGWLYQFKDYNSYRIGIQTQLMFHF